MINAGWANNCGTELFTIGWVPCDTDQPGGGSARPSTARRHTILPPARPATDIQKQSNTLELAAIAVLAIQEFYDE